MKKPSIKLPRKKLLLTMVVVIALVGVTAYQLQELRGLRARVHAIESSRANDAAIDQANADEKVNYEVLSKTEKTVRAEDVNASMYNKEVPEIVYKQQKVYEYKVRITNNTSWTYDYVDGEIKGKTASGNLIAPLGYAVHPEDKQGADTISLAPGGYAEVYVYIPADQEIVDLFYSSYSGA